MDLTQRLSKLYAGAAYDVMRALGHDNCVLPSDILPLVPGQKLCGQVYTLAGRYQEGMDAHETLLAWATVLSKAPAGKVLVCQPNTDRVALMGELSAETLRRKGVLGYVVDGAARDIDFLVEMADFPVYCRFATPKDIVSRWVVAAMGAPITIGTVEVRTGDWLLADRDGVVIIPADMAETVVAEIEAVAGTENAMRQAILDGMDPVAAYEKFGKF